MCGPLLGGRGRVADAGMDAIYCTRPALLLPSAAVREPLCPAFRAAVEAASPSRMNSGQVRGFQRQTQKCLKRRSRTRGLCGTSSVTHGLSSARDGAAHDPRPGVDTSQAVVRVCCLPADTVTRQGPPRATGKRGESR